MSAIFSIVFFFTAVPGHHKTLAWTSRPAPEHISYYNVFMAIPGSGSRWYWIASTVQPSFSLPIGPYYRKFCVSAVPDQTIWPFPETPKSAPITVYLQ